MKNNTVTKENTQKESYLEKLETTQKNQQKMLALHLYSILQG